MGNKAILMSIQPKWTCKILNGNKTIEVRKKFPKDYVGWVYIYCTKGKERLITYDKYLGDETVDGYDATNDKRIIKYGATSILNGYVVARFWCDKVEEIGLFGDEIDTYFGNKEAVNILDNACLSFEELENYLGYKHDYKGYAIHISKLEVFDKPKELKELKTRHYPQFANMEKNTIHYELVSVKKAPQSYMFIEGE